jgi:hypothetical protein
MPAVYMTVSREMPVVYIEATAHSGLSDGLPRILANSPFAPLLSVFVPLERRKPPHFGADPAFPPEKQGLKRWEASRRRSKHQLALPLHLDRAPDALT